jgi:hypothetical protein
MLKLAERLEAGFGAVGANHHELLSSGEVEFMVDPNRISI